jgi:hypothetical protein
MSEKNKQFPRTDVTERHVRRVTALEDAALAEATGGLRDGAFQKVAIPYGIDWNVELRPVVLLP